jgi:hypothetical protein
MNKHVPAAALGLNESIALVGLNHFTVPVAIVISLRSVLKMITRVSRDADDPSFGR